MLAESVQMFIDGANQVMTVAQNNPFDNVTPSAPSALDAKFKAGLGFAKYIGIFVAVIGVIVAGASMALSRREGSAEEATAMALRIGIGAMIIGSATALISFFLD